MRSLLQPQSESAQHLKPHEKLLKPLQRGVSIPNVQAYHTRSQIIVAVDSVLYKTWHALAEGASKLRNKKRATQNQENAVPKRFRKSEKASKDQAPKRRAGNPRGRQHPLKPIAEGVKQPKLRDLTPKRQQTGEVKLDVCHQLYQNWQRRLGELLGMRRCHESATLHIDTNSPKHIASAVFASSMLLGLHCQVAA